MSRTIRTVNKTKQIEEIRKGEEKFYAEYNTTVVIVDEKPTRVKNIEWKDRRTLEQKVNHVPFFYFVAIWERYESPYEEKYFQNKEKAEAYARELSAREWHDIEDIYCAIISFDD